MKKFKYVFMFVAIIVVLSIYVIDIRFTSPKKEDEKILTERAINRSFDVEIHSVGELEAYRSTNVASLIHGDLGKIIYLIGDGVSVKAGDVLIKMDSAPFEEHIKELLVQIREQIGKIELLEQILQWEITQANHQEKTALIEIEAAEIEIHKIMHGDGPIEEAKLKGAMQKTYMIYDELKKYTEDLIVLQKEEFFNPIELKQTEKKLNEEEENYQFLRMQYENFVVHTLPMQLKKAATSIKQSKNKYEEIIKSNAFKIAKVEAQLQQAKQDLNDSHHQLKNAELQMNMTEIKAPTQGMVVLKEDFRNGQRRKPRVGDIAIKNQSILDLPDLETMLVKTKVRELDLFKIQIKALATIEIDAYPELMFQGHVISIGVLALSDFMKSGDEKYFETVILLNSSNPHLRPGMTSRVCIHVNRINNKLSVPIQAVFEINKALYCFVKKNISIAAVPVEIGFSNNWWTEIKDGLEANDEVLLSMPSLSNLVNANLLKLK